MLFRRQPCRAGSVSAAIPASRRRELRHWKRVRKSVPGFAGEKIKTKRRKLFAGNERKEAHRADNAERKNRTQAQRSGRDAGAVAQGQPPPSMIAVRIGHAQMQALPAGLVLCLLLLFPDAPEARPQPALPSGGTKAPVSSAVGGRRRGWRKVSMWRAVHEMCSDGWDLADYECKKDYWAHLGDPSPAPYTSAFGRIPIVRAMNEEGEMLHFANVRSYIEWRADLEKKTSTDSEQWCLLLRGQAGYGAEGVGRGGHLPEQKDIAIPEHYNVSRSLLYEMWKANEEQAQAEHQQQAAADVALAADDEDNPFPEHARSGYMQERETAVQEEEIGSVGVRSNRGAGRQKAKGKRGGAKSSLRLRGGMRAHRSSVLLLDECSKLRGLAVPGPWALRLRGGLTLLTHNMLASPVQGLEETQRYPLKIEAAKVEVRCAQIGFNASKTAAEAAATDGAAVTEEPEQCARGSPGAHGSRDFFLAMIPRLDWDVLLAAVASLETSSALHLTRPLPATAGLALRSGNADTCGGGIQLMMCRWWWCVCLPIMYLYLTLHEIERHSRRNRLLLT